MPMTDEQTEARPGNIATALYLVSGALSLAATLWLLAGIHTGPQPRPGWSKAADRIESRLGTGELVLIHRAGLVPEAGALAGLPTACDARNRKSRRERQQPGALWIVGEKKIDGKLRKLLKRFRSKGTIAYDDVHLYHGWNAKDARRSGGPK